MPYHFQNTFEVTGETISEISAFQIKLVSIVIKVKGMGWELYVSLRSFLMYQGSSPGRFIVMYTSQLGIVWKNIMELLFST